jgi:hypothetical protein
VTWISLGCVAAYSTIERSGRRFRLIPLGILVFDSRWA